MDEVRRTVTAFGAFDRIPMGAFILRGDLAVLFWNRRLEEWTGIRRDDILGTRIDARFPHLGDSKYAVRLRDVFAGGPPAIFSSQLHKYIIPAPLPDGERRIQHTTVTAIQAEDGKEFYALFVIQDVTDLTCRIQGYKMMRDQALAEIKARERLENELRQAHNHLELRVRERTKALAETNRQLQQNIAERKEAEAALRKSEEKFRSIFDNVSVGIALLDNTGGSIQALNGAYCRFLNIRRDDAAGKSFAGFIHPDDREAGKNEHEDLANGKRDHYVIDKRFVRAGGDVVWGRLTVSCIRDDAGQILYTAVVCEDMSERKKIEGELLRAQKLESLGILAGGIAHDFNNLLTAILGNTSGVKKSLEKGSVAYARLAEAETASLRARDLTRQLLTFSKGGMPIKRTTSIGELIRESANFIVRGTDVTCTYSIPDDLWPADVDEGQINQVINNLIINARQAMPDGGTIHIRAENAVAGSESHHPLTDGMYVKISIKDEGTGIPEDHIGKIFDPYFTTKPSGTGLGLSTSYSIVKNHNGYITVESRPGSGTTFFIYLPASREKALHRSRTEGAVPGKGRVLLMDDEEIVRTVAGIMLRDLGYDAEFARDGREAIETYKRAKASDRPFDAVIIDLTIPGGMGGKETIQKLTVLDPAVKAIVSSGYSNDPIMAEFKRYGFRGVVEKPYTLEELSQVLHRVNSNHAE